MIVHAKFRKERSLFGTRLRKCQTYLLIIVESVQFCALSLSKESRLWPQSLSFSADGFIDFGSNSFLVEMDTNLRMMLYFAVLAVYLLVICLNISLLVCIVPRPVRMIFGTMSVVSYSWCIMPAYKLLMQVVG